MVVSIYDTWWENFDMRWKVDTIHSTIYQT